MHALLAHYIPSVCCAKCRETVRSQREEDCRCILKRNTLAKPELAFRLIDGECRNVTDEELALARADNLSLLQAVKMRAFSK